MKVWVIGRNYPTKQNKMCGSFELEQAQMLARQGHEVCYISCPFHPLYKIRNWGYAEWRDDTVHVYAYSQIYFPQRFKIYCDSFKTLIWRKLLERVEHEQGVPDVIHIHYPTMISVPEPILAFKKRGTRIIASEHWTSVLTGNITIHEKKQLKAYVENADRFICVGAPLKQSVLKLTNTNRDIFVVPNIVPDTFKRELIEHQGINFTAVGRLVKVKQFDRLIQAFYETFPDEKDVTLTIIGGGIQYWKLKLMIIKMRIGDRVRLLGPQSRNVVADRMSRSDVLVSYSRLETFGVPVIEGWYSGIPAIATTAIGFADYWKESLGELIPFDNEDELKHVLKKVKSRISEGYYDPQIIGQYAKENFSEKVVYQKLVGLYKN
ncbi:MAG: glycosyltransferase family 4 protein [Lachnospiraceae bacterium]|nr:glycosyltransferase family 4 protein [Lachnospiraceae bacterium]